MPETISVMEALVAKRKIFKGRITRIEGVVQGHRTQPLSDVGVQLYLGKLDCLTKEIDQWQGELAVACTEVQYQEHERSYDEMMFRNEALCITLTPAVSSTTRNATEQTGNAGKEVRLPKLELPMFGGRYEDWLPFRDLFTVTVHSNLALSGAQKLQYLKSALKDEAALLIHSMALTDANYTEAWELLMNRYNNTREIVDAHVKKLFEQPAIKIGSAATIRKLVDTTAESLRALKVLEEPVQSWNTLLLHVIKGKLDAETHKQWELSLKTKDKPTFQNLTDFLEQRARALAASQHVVEHNRHSYGIDNQRRAKVFREKSMSAHHGTARSDCFVCQEEHPTFRCPVFIGNSVSERRILARKHGMCFNCLRGDHRVKDCKTGSCKICNQKHNTLLHNDQGESKESSGKDVTACFSRKPTNNQLVLLSTALVQVKDIYGKVHRVRALLDSGSQASFITERLAQKLQFQRNRSEITVSGIGASGMTKTKGTLNLILQSARDSSISVPVQAIVLTKVTGKLPTSECVIKDWPHLQGLSMADPMFHTPSSVDLVLGADVHGEVMLNGRRRGPPGTPNALETVFGWVILGPVGTRISAKTVSVFHSTTDESVRRFWELEDPPQCCVWSDEEIACENHFTDTHYRLDSGRYVVRLPFKGNHSAMGESRETARQRFLQMERKFRSNPEFGSQYAEFMNEYLSLDHMEPVPKEEMNVPSSQTYYMPHHAVVRESSSTTRLRVVFNASAKTTTEVSLNDILMVGPKVQADLLNLLIRFRMPLIALTADLKQMYRQILVHEKDTNFQRIIWRLNPKEDLQEFRLKTVTYGTSSAPYLATRVLKQLAVDERDRFPIASSVLEEDFYVDDLLTGADDPDDALQLQVQLREITESGGFKLRKWASNNPEVIRDIPAALKEISDDHEIESEESIKTLGLHWHPGTDQFSFRLSNSQINTFISKRAVLSEIAKVFDPFGLLSPVTVRAKILLQQTWQQQLNWDDELPMELQTRWCSYREEMTKLEELKVPRCLRLSFGGQLSLHGYCDASEAAYAAVVYLKSSSPTGNDSVRLVAARTRVAPMKSTSLPRLELCGAVLLVKLLRLVQSSIRDKIIEIHAWSDSTIALAWISAGPSRWKTFVANRVAEIRSTVPEMQWHHIAGENNPADCASRGIGVVELLKHTLWWQGPSRECINLDFVKEEELEKTECTLEAKRVYLATVAHQIDKTVLTKYSTVSKVTRVTAYIQRFIFNCRCTESSKRRSGPLTVTELNEALHYWIRVTQREVYVEEIAALQKKQPLSRKSRILSLTPFLDGQGILRVGGRLEKAELNPDRIHPILLPRGHRLTELLIDAEHLRQLHGGSQLTLACLQRKYWIVGARDAIRSRIQKCIPCVRQRATTVQQLMGELPKIRVSPGRPFLNCGVDYAGPITLRVLKGRSNRRFKAYISVFVCFSTRAIHLELVSDLSSEAFVAALRRFVSRRGKCANLYSDCGTNFVGSDRQLREFVKFSRSAAKTNPVSGWLTDQGIVWHFNPPSAPHFGGLWEAGVKSVKHHLRRTMGNACLTYEEMETLLCQIEACLNSRPITAISSDPSDLSALTPGHFLIGDALTAIPEPDILDVPINRLNCWQVGQHILQHFWKRWKTEYLSRLQQRPKWLKLERNIEVGELVLLKDDNSPPLLWKLGRVIQLHPGEDKYTRVVTVRTAAGQFKRPIVKLCKLPLDN